MHNYQKLIKTGNYQRALFVFALFQISTSQGQNQEPKELTEARNSYNAELQKAIKPVNDRYLPKLEELKKQLTFKGDIKGAVAVEDVITNMNGGGQSLEQQGDKNPQELREINKNYIIELETATKPVRSLYLAKLEVLKQQLALNGALKAALAVEQEMEKVKAQQNYITPQTSLKNCQGCLGGHPDCTAACRAVGHGSTGACAEPKSTDPAHCCVCYR